MANPNPNPDNLPVQVMEEVQALVQSIAAFAGKTITVYDDMNALDKLTLVTPPMAGLVYNGIRALPQQGSGPKGISCELSFTVLLITNGETIIKTDQKFPSMTLLGNIRSAILGVRSVTGSFYQFQVEAPAQTKAGKIFWAQRWVVPIQMTPNK